MPKASVATSDSITEDSGTAAPPTSDRPRVDSGAAPASASPVASTKAPVERAAVAPDSEPHQREWTSGGGSYRTKAKFIRLADGKVVLQKEEGKQINVSLGKVSPADREYVKALLKTDNRAEVILCKVTKVIDGDIIVVVDIEKVQHELRLVGIDAPESEQSYGKSARNVLSDKILNKHPWIEWMEYDEHGRKLGHVYLDGRDINLEMVAGGYAWHYKEQSSDPRLGNAEFVARRKRVGLWKKTQPTPPWEFRVEK